MVSIVHVYPGVLQEAGKRPAMTYESYSQSLLTHRYHLECIYVNIAQHSKRITRSLTTYCSKFHIFCSLSENSRDRRCSVLSS